jgi:uncharacterized protein (TIGR02217 family)
MSFIDARLNSHYQFGFSGGPQFSTLRKELPNGRVRKNRNWLYPIGKWTTDYALLSPAEREQMRAAIWACGGGFSDFRFKDWDDYQAKAQQFHVGDNTTTARQLIRTYTFGPVSFSRPITLPLNVRVYDQDNNTLAVTVNATTGMVTPTNPWPTGKAIYWDGEFDVRACFEEDYNPFTWDSGVTASCPVSIIESRG